MAISIVSGSASMAVTSRPGVQAPVVGATSVRFPSSTIQCTGRVQFDGSAADPVNGWLVGWIQAQWIETNWGYYRGQRNDHGSAFVQRARPPSRPGQACRDTVGPVADVFYSTSAGLRSGLAGGAGFPKAVNVLFRDTPSETYAISINNSLTGQRNFLREVQLEFHFCTILVVKDPANVFHQLKHVYWNMRWQHRFTATAFPPAAGTLTVTGVAAGIGGNISRAFSGAATDRRFAGVLTSAQGNSCNQVAANAFNNPNLRQSRVWENFAVTR